MAIRGHAAHWPAAVAIVPWLGYLPSIAMLIAGTAAPGRGHQPPRGRRVSLGSVDPLAAVCRVPAHPSTSRRVDFDLLAIVPAAFAGVAWGILGGALAGNLAIDHDGAPAAIHLRPCPHRCHRPLASTLRRRRVRAAPFQPSRFGTPGTNAAATVADGYAMKQQGRAGEALGISLYSGVIGGLVGIAVLVLLTERLSTIALAFTPAAYSRSAFSASASSPRCRASRS